MEFQQLPASFKKRDVDTNIGLALGGAGFDSVRNKRNASEGASVGLTACNDGDEGVESGSKESRFLIRILAWAA